MRYIASDMPSVLNTNVLVAAGDMVLEVAANGQASAIMTLNHRGFLPQSLAFGIAVISPEQFFQGAK